MRRTIAIVGAGLCGASAAKALRAGGCDDRIVVLGEEQHPPYDRPPLSKEFLKTGEVPWLDVHTHAADLDVDLRLGVCVTELDAAHGRLQTTDGVVDADLVLLATGGRPRPLSVPGGEGGAVHLLRTLDDAQRLRVALVPGARVVVVGAGFIGGEIASTATALGCTVSIVELLPEPFVRVLGPQLGGYLADLHGANGVEIRCGVGIDRVLADGDSPRAVVLADGVRLEADVVVAGVGIEPNVELAVQAGLVTANGIVVDAALRTSVPTVFAAGDVALRPSELRGAPVRLEHWRSAIDLGEIAAASMLGRALPQEPVPWFWTDQHGVNLQMAGHPDLRDETLVRGSLDAHDACLLWLRDRVITGAVGVNRPAEIRAAMRLIGDGREVDLTALADDSMPLKKVVALARAV